METRNIPAQADLNIDLDNLLSKSIKSDMCQSAKFSTVYPPINAQTSYFKICTPKKNYSYGRHRILSSHVNSKIVDLIGNTPEIPSFGLQHITIEELRNFPGLGNVSEAGWRPGTYTGFLVSVGSVLDNLLWSCVMTGMDQRFAEIFHPFL